MTVQVSITRVPRNEAHCINLFIYLLFFFLILKFWTAVIKAAVIRKINLFSLKWLYKRSLERGHPGVYGDKSLGLLCAIMNTSLSLGNFSNIFKVLEGWICFRKCSGYDIHCSLSYFCCNIWLWRYTWIRPPVLILEKQNVTR